MELPITLCFMDTTFDIKQRGSTQIGCASVPEVPCASAQQPCCENSQGGTPSSWKRILTGFVTPRPPGRQRSPPRRNRTSTGRGSRPTANPPKDLVRPRRHVRRGEARDNGTGGGDRLADQDCERSSAVLCWPHALPPSLPPDRKLGNRASSGTGGGREPDCCRHTRSDGGDSMRALIDIAPSPEQLTILSDAGPGFRLIRGAAGSGKTTASRLRLRQLCGSRLARRARLGSEEPVRVLVLTFNRTLRGYVLALASEQVSNSNALQLTIETFGRWARHLVGPRKVIDGTRWRNRIHAAPGRCFREFGVDARLARLDLALQHVVAGQRLLQGEQVFAAPVAPQAGRNGGLVRLATTVPELRQRRPVPLARDNGAHVPGLPARTWNTSLMRSITLSADSRSTGGKNTCAQRVPDAAGRLRSRNVCG